MRDPDGLTAGEIALIEDLETEAAMSGGCRWVMPWQVVGAARQQAEEAVAEELRRLHASGFVHRQQSTQTGERFAVVQVCPDEPICRVCGCTEYRACESEHGPCWWTEANLCSACDPTVTPVRLILPEQVALLEQVRQLALEIDALQETLATIARRIAQEDANHELTDELVYNAAHTTVTNYLQMARRTVFGLPDREGEADE